MVAWEISISNCSGVWSFKIHIPVKQFIRRKISNLLAPIIREALTKREEVESHDIDRELQLRARCEAADFAQNEMGNAKPIADSDQLLEWAFGKSELKPGELVLEFGVWKGRTLRNLANLTKGDVHGFDSFEGLPEGWRWHYEKGRFGVTQLPKVPANAKLWKGWFKDTLPGFLKEHTGPIGFMHVDCDLYSSTKEILELTAERFRPGTVIVFDEYYNYPGWREGEYKAFLEYLEKSCARFEYLAFCTKDEQVAVKIL